MFDLSGKVLDWFWSYLEKRFQRVSVQGILSGVKILLSGVPQDSVLGPLVFTMYNRPLGITAQRYGVKYHSYAEDTAVYITGSWQWVKFLLFHEEIRTLYCWYSAMNDPKSSKI